MSLAQEFREFLFTKTNEKQQQERNMRNTGHLFWDCLASHSLFMASPLLFWGWGSSIPALSVVHIANSYALHSHSVLTQTRLSASPLPVIALCCYSMTEPFNTSLVHVKLYGQIVKLKAQFCHKLSFSTAGQ